MRGNNRIIIAVDSREVEPSGSGLQLITDRECKMAILGDKYAFVGDGLIGHQKDDAAPRWKSTDEALEAYRIAGNSLNATAAQWGKQISERVKQLYGVEPLALQQWPREEVLSDGFFVGEDEKGNLVLCRVMVRIAEINLLGPQMRADVVEEELPFSSTRITIELMKRKTARAQRVDKQWKAQLMHIPKRDQRWRWLQYMVKRTEEFNQKVGGSVEVLEIQKGKEPHWLAHESCS